MVTTVPSVGPQALLRPYIRTWHSQLLLSAGFGNWWPLITHIVSRVTNVSKGLLGSTAPGLKDHLTQSLQSLMHPFLHPTMVTVQMDLGISPLEAEPNPETRAKETLQPSANLLPSECPFLEWSH